jgi:hypothetical protein
LPHKLQKLAEKYQKIVGEESHEITKTIQEEYQQPMLRASFKPKPRLRKKREEYDY